MEIMMEDLITQQQAEQLLATATPNTWAVSEVQDHLKEEHKFSDIFYYDEKGMLPRIGVMTHQNVHLAAASPDLARTVIWLWEQNQQQQAKIERLQDGVIETSRGEWAYVTPDDMEDELESLIEGDMK